MNVIDFDLTGMVNFKLDRFVTSPSCVNKVRSTLFSKLNNKASCFQLSSGYDFAEFESFLNALNKFNMFNNLFVTRSGKIELGYDEGIMNEIMERINEYSQIPFIYYTKSEHGRPYVEGDFNAYYEFYQYIPNEKFGKDSDKMKFLPEIYRTKLPIGKWKSDISFIYIPSCCNDRVYKNYVKANSDGYNMCRFMKATHDPMKLLPLLMEVTYEDSGFSK